jgi:ABC-type glycerol-3-phosphate transport system permease component
MMDYRLRRWAVGIVTILLTLIMLIVVLGPFYWVLLSSFRFTKDILDRQVQLLPTYITLENWHDLIGETIFPAYLKNSVIITSLTLILAMGLSVLAAFGFRRFVFPGKTLLQRGLLFVYLFPSVILLIPLYKLMALMDLIDTPWSLVLVYVAFTAPFSVWLLESFFQGIPREVDEAAIMEGAGHLQILYKIFIPLTAPGLVSVATFIIVYAWSEYMFAVVFLNQETAMTLPIGVALFMSVVRQEWGLVGAGATGVVLPVMLLFGILGQRFIRNMTEGILK